MNHLEAQSYIMPFIEGTLPESKHEDFCLHMNSCAKCHEELEIYYTLIVGMKQLDSKQELATDFSKDLENKLKKLENSYRGRRRIRFSTFTFLMILIIAGIFVFYGRALAKVYNFEERKKLESQGDYYFGKELSPILLRHDKDIVEESKKLTQKPKFTLVEKLDNYSSIKESIVYNINCGRQVLDEILQKRQEEELEKDSLLGEDEYEENFTY